MIFLPILYGHLQMAIYCCALIGGPVLDHMQKLGFLRSGPCSYAKCMHPLEALHQLEILHTALSGILAVRFMDF